MIERMQGMIAGWMNRVRVNRIREDVRDGMPVLIKRRRIGGSFVIWWGNLFLAAAGSGARMFVRCREWMAWEAACARLLYPERPAVMTEGSRSVVVPKAAGRSLRQLIRRDEASAEAFAAATREVRRVHQIRCAYFQEAWSHGDLHLDNILYDADLDRAVLIDFDTRHDAAVSRIRRQGDDLKLMLLELLGVREELWHSLTRAVIETYGEPVVLGELGRQLTLPRGWGKVLWHTQTNMAVTRQVEERLQELRSMIERAASATMAGADTQRYRDVE